MVDLSDRERISMIGLRSAVLIQITHVTDRQTDGIQSINQSIKLYYEM